MHSDHYYAIGKDHHVCQDYARSSGYNEVYAVVSDGCSSSPDTDIGARLLVTSAIRAIKRGSQLDQPEALIYGSCGDVPPIISDRCLDATLLAVLTDEVGDLIVQAYGDGVVFAITREGELLSWEVDARGAPPYPSYLLEPSRRDYYVQEGYGDRVVFHRHFGRDGTGVLKLDAESPWAPFSLSFNPKEYRLVGVATDGLLSFRDIKTKQPISLVDVLKHVTNAPVPTGRFVERSSSHFLRKVCPKLGWEHGDDYGMAMVYCGEE